MRELFWKLRYALNIQGRTGMPWRTCWQCAVAGWDMNKDFPLSPIDAVTDELSYWTD